MVATDPGSAREEAERLVATLLATARLAAANPTAGAWGPLGGIVASVLGHSGRSTEESHPESGGFATGTAECCICPVCRGMAALRDPSPEFAERLATGAGDLAAGVASLMRAFASANPPPRPAYPSAEAGGGASDNDLVWREATRSGHDSQPASEEDVWSSATRADDTTAPAVPVPPVDDAGPAAATADRAPADRPVVPASRAPGDVGADAPGDGA
ncbi:hypothetical protein D7147_15780 [Micromonospora musae]|uniref:Uncharacterized protein n=1 Tax=Micromonospora musae TaxID=1894970 RepID=A0A3A9YCD9_9ACTN|nr:hypothetical protein [Micromonospora musae]RKN19191.1 hypothetical protein D7147_15780 [Micromonospora musae]RKN34909.1 hypothetical protein D7044_07675 [Micromonospora musae]